MFNYWITLCPFANWSFLNQRLYISYSCPYAQRTWITRNCKVVSLGKHLFNEFSVFLYIFFLSCNRISWLTKKLNYWICFSFFWKQGLQDKIKLVPIDLQNRPAWYKEKVYPPNKVKKNNFRQSALWNVMKWKNNMWGSCLKNDSELTWVCLVKHTKFSNFVDSSFLILFIILTDSFKNLMAYKQIP